MEGEVWKDIISYEDSYEVSNHGNIRSKSRTVHFSDGVRARYYPSQSLKITYPLGYPMVALVKDRNSKRFPVYMLVAKAFLKNPNNYQYVKHIDGDGRNVKLNNLKWSKDKPTGKYIHSPTVCRPMAALLNGTIVKNANNIEELSIWLNRELKRGHQDETVRRGISNTINGHTKSYYGYTFKYTD